MSSPAFQDIRVEPRLARASDAAPVTSAPASRNVEPSAAVRRRFGHYLTRPIQRLLPFLFSFAVLAVLAVGWSRRQEEIITPESGIGYWLGIAGGSMMLLLLLYPLRKRSRLLRRLGRVPRWFRLHMLFGVIGPVLILFHSNFRLGSLNSNMALFAMAMVVGSGIVGRYLYVKVHQGLYGLKADVGTILGDAAALKDAVGTELDDGAGTLLADLRLFETSALARRPGLGSSLWAFVLYGARARLCRRRALKLSADLLATQAPHRRWSRWERRRRLKAIDGELRIYFAAIRKAARFAVFERLFALWHVLHLPLFLLLVVTAVIHVVAVHHY